MFQYIFYELGPRKQWLCCFVLIVFRAAAPAKHTTPFVIGQYIYVRKCFLFLFWQIDGCYYYVLKCVMCRSTFVSTNITFDKYFSSMNICKTSNDGDGDDSDDKMVLVDDGDRLATGEDNRWPVCSMLNTQSLSWLWFKIMMTMIILNFHQNNKDGLWLYAQCSTLNFFHDDDDINFI